MILKYKDFGIGDEDGAWTYVEASKISVYYEAQSKSMFVRACEKNKILIDIPICETKEIAFILNEKGEILETVTASKKENVKNI